MNAANLSALELNHDDIAIYREELDRAVAKRDRLIRKALDEGESLRAIARAAGLSHTAVAKIRDR